MNNYSFCRTYRFTAQTPLVHFSWREKGSTLRATELKPKLDTYLCKLYKEQAGELPRKWLIQADKTALNYKIKVLSVGERKNVKLGMRTQYDMYYSNVDPNSPEIKGILSDIQVSVICIIPELLSFLDANIYDFFAITNFGNAQGKGFGSFAPADEDYDETKISALMKKNYGAKRCYVFDGGEMPMKNIKIVYSLIKSGVNLSRIDDTKYERSLLFKYMHEKYEMGNEKAWLKANGVVPTIGQYRCEQFHKFYYVRALLGICEHMEFRNKFEKGATKIQVKIKETSGEIDKAPSPIFFKVIENKIYLVAKRINRELYGKAFEFSIEDWTGTVTVPTLEELGEDFIDEFLEYAVNEINNNCKKNIVGDINITEV